MSMDELNRMAVQIRILEEQIGRLQSQIEVIQNSILTLETSNFTIENMMILVNPSPRWSDITAI